MARRKKQVLSGIVLLLILTAVASGALFFAEYLLTNKDLQEQIASFGYLGVIVIAAIAGLNVILPIPAVAFTPVFTAAGLSLGGIILALTIGTLIADFIGYVFGRVSRSTMTEKYPKLIARLEHIHHNHRTWLVPIIFLYAAFMPVPNEALIIPLALLGVSWRTMVLPLFIGNLVNQSIYAYGMYSMFRLLF
ncbi:MAG: VTT domain-containing protein [Candidatus Pacebacteria bacterium]|jgi:membrane protein YqaA with SNARE-associated domain|nr:VTT domain-containing protein [Candidatus Paceibacterota bacterium]